MNFYAFFFKKICKTQKIVVFLHRILQKSQGIVFPALQNNIMKNLRKQTWGGTPKIENTRLDTDNE